MTDDYKSIQKNVFSSQFNKFYKKNLSMYMSNIEKLRKNYLYGVYAFIGIAVLSILVYVVYGTIEYGNFLDLSQDSFKVLFYMQIIIVCIIFYIIRSYKRKVKPMILPKLLSFVGDFHLVDKDVLGLELRKYVKSLSLFDSYNRFDVDDRIEGMYKNLKVSIAEICLTKETGSGKRKRTVLIFDGILITVPCLKKYRGYTFIKQNSLNIINNKHEQKVNLEDPEFEKYYDVFSTDQIEARYLITTAFMNRMVQLAKRGIGKNITLSFEHGNVNIAVSSSKDWFEMPILKPANDISIYRAIILELITILKIIDSLKLDKNIGL